LNLIKGSIEKKPEYITAWNKLGKIMEEKISDNDSNEKKEKYLKLSKKFYDKSLAIDPFNFQGRLGIATYHFKLKEYKKCDNELNKITLPQEANDVRCLKLKADNYYAMEDFSKALDMYLKCKNVESSFKDEVQMSIGNCYYTMDDYKNATQTFKELEAKLPLNIDIKVKLAACHMMERQVGMAVAVFKNCIELEPDRWDLYLYLAKVYMHDNKFEEAAQCIQSYNAKNPDDLTGHVKLAEMYETLGAHQSAVEELEVWELLRRSPKPNRKLRFPQRSLSPSTDLSEVSTSRNSSVIKIPIIYYSKSVARVEIRPFCPVEGCPSNYRLDPTLL
jgi:predicted Zn-dependent protease